MPQWGGAVKKPAPKKWFEYDLVEYTLTYRPDVEKRDDGSREPWLLDYAVNDVGQDDRHFATLDQALEWIREHFRYLPKEKR